MSLDFETTQALNALLEDARANVEILVELVNGATEITERETCTALGQLAVLLSGALRERLTLAGKTVTVRVNGVVLHILDTERYDDRLHAFARHQAGICERAEALSATTNDYETRAVLRDLYDAAVRGALWCEQRAAAFASSRLLVFGSPRAATVAAPPEPDESPDVAEPPEARGEHPASSQSAPHLDGADGGSDGSDEQ